jgi:hypothetical protein
MLQDERSRPQIEAEMRRPALREGGRSCYSVRRAGGMLSDGDGVPAYLDNEEWAAMWARDAEKGTAYVCEGRGGVGVSRRWK